MNIVNKIALLVSIATAFASCQGNKEAKPEDAISDWHLFLDTRKMLADHIVKYGPQMEGYVETIKQSDGKVDSNFLSGTMVDWQKYIDAFMLINLHDSSNASKYRQVQVVDSIRNTIDLRYEPLYSNLPVQNMVVTMNGAGTEVREVYGEVLKKSAFSVDHKYIAYTPGKQIQIVTEQGEKDGKIARQAATLFFKVRPQVTIQAGE